MTELRHRLAGGLSGDRDADLGPPMAVGGSGGRRSRQLVLNGVHCAEVDQLTVRLKHVKADPSGVVEPARTWLGIAAGARTRPRVEPATDGAPHAGDTGIDRSDVGHPGDESRGGNWYYPDVQSNSTDTDSDRVPLDRVGGGDRDDQGDDCHDSEPPTDPLGLPLPAVGAPPTGDGTDSVSTHRPETPPRTIGRRMTPLVDSEQVSSDQVGMPAAPAMVVDRSGRIVQANPALLRLAGRDTGDPFGAELDALSGVQLSQLLLGPDDDARLLRADGSRVRVRVVRWELPATGQSAVLVVEMGVAGDPTPLENSTADSRWTAELERLLRVGRWSYELATGRLHRSDNLDELYRSIGIDPEPADSRAVERDQVAMLCQGLRFGDGPLHHHVQVQLPGEGKLSCRAEVELAADGTALRIVGMVRDLSPDRVSERRLGQSGQRFADLMAIIPGGVLLLDPIGRVVDANAGLCTLLDLPLEGLRGVSMASLCADSDIPYPDALGPIDDAPAMLPDWLREVPTGARHSYRVNDVALQRRDGTAVWCEVAVSATRLEEGGRFWLVVCTDVSERRRAAELLRSVGSVDELTRLPNRVATVELVDRLLAGPERNRVAVVCGDIDDFQRVNSSLGHEAGDELLVMLAGRLQRELPVGCTAARLSGDEFVVICSDHAEVGGPDLLARTVADLLRTTITVGGRPVQLTASVGLATPRGEVRAADLLRFAEAAMHDAKRRERRGGIGMATDRIVNSALHALELEAELRSAIATGALVLDYQPVVAPDGTILSAEALVRWPHPVRGLIPPSDFLPVASRSGLLRELDLWVLRTATQEASTWPEHQGRRPSVAVNLAGLLPADIDFLPVVNAIVDDSGLPPARLVLELVETSLVALPPHARAAMDQLVERGIRFAVDDFGTGYSSLGRLKELPAQTVKVDRTFVTDVADDPVDFAVARAVVDMARAMGRTTVAEGVETAEQFHKLRAIGVDAYQGWLFAKGLPATELRNLLAGDRMATPSDTSPGL